MYMISHGRKHTYFGKFLTPKMFKIYYILLLARYNLVKHLTWASCLSHDLSFPSWKESRETFFNCPHRRRLRTETLNSRVTLQGRRRYSAHTSCRDGLILGETSFRLRSSIIVKACWIVDRIRYTIYLASTEIYIRHACLVLNEFDLL